MKLRHVIVVFFALGMTACAGYYNSNGSATSPTQTVSGNPTPVDFAAVSIVFKNNRCLNCHSGPNPDHGLDLTVYAQAKAAGKAIQGDVDSGDMPEGGPHLNAADQAVVDAWVLQGTPDTVMPPPLAPAQPPTLPPSQPPTVTPDQITFAQVTTVFENNKCLNCHSGTKPAAKLDLTQYAAAHAAAADIQKDVDTGKMPKKANPLSPADLAIIDTWVQEGAPN